MTKKTKAENDQMHDFALNAFNLHLMIASKFPDTPYSGRVNVTAFLAQMGRLDEATNMLNGLIEDIKNGKELFTKIDKETTNVPA